MSRSLKLIQVLPYFKSIFIYKYSNFKLLNLVFKDLFTFLLTCILTLFFIGFLHAETELLSQDSEHRFYVVLNVTAEGSEVELEEKSPDIVYDAEEILSAQEENVAALISKNPQIISSTGRRGEPILSLRGFEQHQIQVLLDGIPISEAFDGLLGLDKIPTSIIDSITISSLANSVLYNPDNLGGVINIKTKSGSTAGINGMDKTTLSGSAGWDSFDAQQYTLSGGGSIKYQPALDYFFSAQYLDQPGFKLANNFEPARNEDGGRRNNSDQEGFSVFTKLGLHSNSSQRLSLITHFIDQAWGAPPHVSTSYPQYWRFNSWEKQLVGLAWENNLKPTSKAPLFHNIHLGAHLFWDGYENILDAYDDDSYSSQELKRAWQSTYDDYSLGGDFYCGAEVSILQPLIFSAHFKRDVHRAQSDYGDPWQKFISDTYSIGAEGNFNYCEAYSSKLGCSLIGLEPKYANNGDLRSDLITYAPFISFLYEQDSSTNIGISLARKVRLPTLKELYAEHLGFDVANPDLKVEKSIRTELFYAEKFDRLGLFFRSAFHYSFLEDLIDIVYLGQDQRMLDNIDQAVYFGCDLDLTWKAQDYFEIESSYAFLHARDLSSDRDSDYLEYKPEHCAFIKFKEQLPFNLTCIEEIIYTGKSYFYNFDEKGGSTAGNIWQELPNYTLVNLDLSRPVFKECLLYFKIENLADENYQSQYGYPEAGRCFKVGFNFGFNFD